MVNWVDISFPSRKVKGDGNNFSYVYLKTGGECKNIEKQLPQRRKELLLSLWQSHSGAELTGADFSGSTPNPEE